MDADKTRGVPSGHSPELDAVADANGTDGYSEVVEQELDRLTEAKRREVRTTVHDLRTGDLIDGYEVTHTEEAGEYLAVHFADRSTWREWPEAGVTVWRYARPEDGIA